MSPTPSKSFCPSPPPSSSAALPPSPPNSPPQSLPPSATAPIVSHIRRLRNGDSTASSPPGGTYPLPPAEYASLEADLHSAGLWDFYQHKIRSDYLPSEARYFLRMPTALHEFFAGPLLQTILVKVRELATRVPAQVAQHLTQLQNGLNTDVVYTDHGKQSPDGQLNHPEYAFPAAVFEVAYSQKRTDLPKVAQSYILRSRLNVRCVVGLDIEYRSPRSSRVAGAAQRAAAVSVWRPHRVGAEIRAQCQVKNVLFRTENGTAGDAELEMTLPDLLPEDILESLDDGTHVH